MVARPAEQLDKNKQQNMTMAVCVCLQVAGVCGDSGHGAAASAEAGFKPGHGPVSHLRRSRTCVRVWWRRAGPATRSPARVSSFSVCACRHFSVHPCLSFYASWLNMSVWCVYSCISSPLLHLVSLFFVHPL